MSDLKHTRIESIDLLRGIVMVIMALDHTRDYFHFGSMISDPTDMETTTPILFFTRFITHFCAPVFVFLAGTSAYLSGQKKSRPELSRFLWTRGLWLIVLEIVLNNLIWWFDPLYHFINLQVLWAIGLCMIIMAMLIRLPWKGLFIIGLLILFGHNFLDRIQVEGYSPLAILWYLTHQFQFLPISETRVIGFFYPFLPWLGIMILGYCLGSLYQKDFPASERKPWLIRMGLGAIFAFGVIRAVNVYGDPVAWEVQRNAVYSLLSFINVTKYPPSLLFTLITLGPALLLLVFSEKWKNRLTDFFLVYGRVPLFYYFLHVLFIHTGAILGLILTGDDWRRMILTPHQMFYSGDMTTYGYPLGIVYLIWIGVVLLCYPFCKKYMQYKAGNRDKWWLSYL
ncbi:MAG: heparan-alpha-glucosaminide N-acetyltransferase domain-containing protein [Bacteroidota bacterium]